MESASSQPLRSHEPNPLHEHQTFWVWFACLGALGIGATATLHALNLGNWTHSAATWSMAGALVAFWSLHLRVSGLPPLWVGLFTACMLVVWRRQSVAILAVGWTNWWSALGCAVFVYAMLCVLSTHERERGLQPLATTALILAIGVLARPPVIMGCILVSLLILFGEYRNERRPLSSMLLLFTPVCLCWITLSFMNHFSSTGLLPVEWRWNTSAVTAGPPFDALSEVAFRQVAPTLILMLAILAVRLLEEKIGKPDLAFLFLSLFLGTVGTIQVMPGRLSGDDVQLILTGGCCALIALDPPARLLARLLVCSAAIGPFVVDAWR